jgi:hypothetical protein
VHRSVTLVALLELNETPVVPGYCIGRPFTRVTESVGTGVGLGMVEKSSIAVAVPPDPVAVQTQCVG